MAKLVVLSGEMKDKTFELTEDRLTIGRTDDNQVHLPDSAVSSHHAEFSRREDDYVIRDLNSTNGTRVNGQRIVETRLYHGDAVWFGNLECQYLSSAKSAPQPAPSLKKTVDLSTTVVPTSVKRPKTFQKADPFNKNATSTKSKRVLQALIVLFSLVIVGLLAYVVIVIIK